MSVRVSKRFAGLLALAQLGGLPALADVSLSVPGSSGNAGDSGDSRSYSLQVDAAAAGTTVTVIRGMQTARRESAVFVDITPATVTGREHRPGNDARVFVDITPVTVVRPTELSPPAAAVFVDITPGAVADNTVASAAAPAAISIDAQAPKEMTGHAGGERPVGSGAALEYRPADPEQVSVTPAAQPETLTPEPDAEVPAAAHTPAADAVATGSLTDAVSQTDTPPPAQVAEIVAPEPAPVTDGPEGTRSEADTDTVIMLADAGEQPMAARAEPGENVVAEPDEARPAGANPNSASNDQQPCVVPPGENARRPGTPVLEYEPRCDPTAAAPPRPEQLQEFPPVPDRWRIVSMLGYPTNLLDPYNGNNPLKGDLPLYGKDNDWFFNLLVISDTVFEPRRFPVPVGGPSTLRPGGIDLFGSGRQTLLNQNFIVELVWYKGDTVFRPPDWEFRFIPVFNYSDTRVDEISLLKPNPGFGLDRREGFVGVQGLFVDKHLRNVSTRYDFDSLRVGIQPFSSDFRGFLFQDNQFGVRLFGTRDNNFYQYNLAWFRRLEKDANSGLNDITERSFGDSLRDDDVFVFNVYRQDFPRLGFFSQLTLLHNRNREASDVFYEDNGFIQRPASIGTERSRDYDVTYLGYNGDGHFGRNNLTTSLYFAFGDETNSTFTNFSSDIRAWFFAAEYSRDYDWIRPRLSILHGSGDSDPYDDRSEGYDAVFENPQFAGADTSFWIRQAVPLVGGGRVGLSGRNGILNSLRPSKEFGQSNFTNPGIWLLGLGADLDLTPELRFSVNANQLWFDDTASVALARNQGNVDKNIGLDISAAFIYRPFATQNIVFRASGAALLPGQGYKDLFGDEIPFSVLANLVLQY